MEKAFSLGLTLGRFQTFHTGHVYMLEKACAVCERVGVFIGSSQESGTAKNPFSYELRKELIQSVMGDRVEIFPLPDLGVGNCPDWGKYVMDSAKECFGELPDLIVSGSEGRRLSWFDENSEYIPAELYVSKTIDISASRMRELFIENKRAEWKKYTSPELWKRYTELRKIVLASKDNEITMSI